MIKSFKEKVCLLLIILVLQGCSFYYMQNRTDKNQLVAITYKNSDRAKYAEVSLKKAKRDVTKIMKECDDSSCTLKFELYPKRTLLLPTILAVTDLAPKEERIVNTYGIDKNAPDSTDTILYKSGRRMVINKFKLKQKPFVLLGRKTYAYYFR